MPPALCGQGYNSLHQWMLFLLLHCKRILSSSDYCRNSDIELIWQHVAMAQRGG